MILLVQLDSVSICANKALWLRLTYFNKTADGGTIVIRSYVRIGSFENNAPARFAWFLPLSAAASVPANKMRLMIS